jgi:crotonobetainyl-CoA:carnitine CoA-transferase CaiB-like acyl-CoA transferase
MTVAHAGPARPAGPLDGIRVLDLTRVIMGPFATRVLGDQGADVILVESNDADVNRVMGAGNHPQLSGTTLNLLRNKRSVELDLKTPAGRDHLEAIVRTCDVVVTTMRPSALAKLGVSYEDLSKVRPDVIYCQAQGFSLSGSRADDPAYDDIIQAACGVSDIMEQVWGQPALIPTILADKVCGLMIAQAVTAALLHRERSGEGQHIEVPMYQAMSAFMLVEHGDGAILEPPVSHPGYRRVLSRERRPHPTKDGYVHIFPYLPKHYATLFSEAGRPDADQDPRYADKRATLLNSDSLYRDIRRIAPTRTTDEWLRYCRDAGIPATRVGSLQDLVDDLPIAHHEVVGDYRTTPMTANFSRTPATIRREAPTIGQHTAEVLGEVSSPLVATRPSSPPIRRSS